MILMNGKRYYPIELERVVSSSGAVVYDREIWKLRSQLLDSNHIGLQDSNGDRIVLGRFAALGISVYISSFSGKKIDEFIEEVLS